ncbi:MAG: trigger factor, partial [Chloroflexota bacterium]
GFRSGVSDDIIITVRVKNEREESRELILEVEAEPAEESKAVESAARRLAQRVKVPGFRPGKAPRELIERYVGRDYLLGEAAEDFASRALPEALKARKVEPFVLPRVEVIGREPLAFRATVPLEPVVEPGDYRSVSVSVAPPAVSDEAVDKALQEAAYERSPWEPSPGPVQMGSLVVMDLEATVDGAQVISQKGVQYLVRAEPPVPVPGFAEQLLGIAPGEDKQFSLPFPADHPREDLRGKEGAFRVKVHEIKEKHPAPPGDDLAKALGWENLTAMREGVAQRLRARAEAEAQREVEERVVSEVVGGARAEYSPLLVERELERLVREQNLRPNEKVLEELRPLATRRLLRSLVLDKVAQAEGIEVKDEEVSAEVERMSQGGRGAEVRRFFTSAGASQALREGLCRRKAVVRLVALATGEGAVQKEGA